MAEMSDLIKPAPLAVTLATPSAIIEHLRTAADSLDESSRAASTRRAYDARWRVFVQWCDRMGLSSDPAEPEVVRLFVVDMAQARQPRNGRLYTAATIDGYVAAIAYHQDRLGHGRGIATHHKVAQTLRALRNVRQEAPHRKRPLLLDDINRLIDGMDHSTWPAGQSACRDTLAIWLGFALALRRSEVAALTVGAVTLHPQDGLHVRIGASKTDQAGRGALLAVPFGTSPRTCVPCAWARWIHLLASAESRPERMRRVFATGAPVSWSHQCVEDGAGTLQRALSTLDAEAPLLRSVTKAGVINRDGVTSDALARALKRRAHAAGIPDIGGVGYHSLRSGFVTTARRNGADLRAVTRQTRQTVGTAEIYDREVLPLEGNAVLHLGL